MKYNDGPGHKATRLGPLLAGTLLEMFSKDFDKSSKEDGRKVLDQVYGPEWRKFTPKSEVTQRAGG